MHDARRLYSRRMLGALFAYAALLAISIPLTEAYPDAAWRYPLAVLPMAPFLYAISAYVRYLGSSDELDRRIALESLAIAFGATAAITFAYGFLENVGLPHINWLWVWAVMGASWIAGGLYARRRYR